MGSNVDKIVDDILGRVRPLVREAVQKADADARGELMTQLNKAIASSGNGNGKAAAVASPVKRKVGRPRKNPLPETETETASPATSTEKPKKTKAKQKRVLSAEVKAKLAENLKKAREAKADKAKPVKRKVGRPKKVQAPAPAPAEQAS